MLMIFFHFWISAKDSRGFLFAHVREFSAKINDKVWTTSSFFLDKVDVLMDSNKNCSTLEVLILSGVRVAQVDLLAETFTVEGS